MQTLIVNKNIKIWFIKKNLKLLKAISDYYLNFINYYH